MVPTTLRQTRAKVRQAEARAKAGRYQFPPKPSTPPPDVFETMDPHRAASEPTHKEEVCNVKVLLGAGTPVERPAAEQIADEDLFPGTPRTRMEYTARCGGVGGG